MCFVYENSYYKYTINGTTIKAYSSTDDTCGNWKETTYMLSNDIKIVDEIPTHILELNNYFNNKNCILPYKEALPTLTVYPNGCTKLSETSSRKVDVTDVKATLTEYETADCTGEGTENSYDIDKCLNDKDIRFSRYTKYTDGTGVIFVMMVMALAFVL
ncbi:hypothetical protein EIN_343030 [Entamoeba invadens IP1]|uniref:Uncharacterized protein n=1 Tax=Entamoeba invadens IP1 TaxID=370355 RepID=A0A0A1TV14_ENTIV|nr:hypothetical protein EIN_343030 [Entamoeba invadens IP1]ELP84148.1 hypothetical protein EIN_343030 [Entamoeba invadens IP1]|eukprot:XP_004183494.1 hypothetical protein EIN_343030 [Entamoeba invadens IP1]